MPPIRYRLISERLSVTPSTTTESVPVGEMVELTGLNFSTNHQFSPLTKRSNNGQLILPSTSTNLSTTTMNSQTTVMTTLLTSGISANGCSEAISSNSYDSMPTAG